MALLGTSAISASAQPPDGLAMSSAWPRSAAATAGSGCSIDSASGASTAVIAAAAVSRITNDTIACRATRPECAASLAWLMPTTTSANTNGTTVICSALSQSLPNGSTMPATRLASAGSDHASRMPMTIPATRPVMTRAVVPIT